MICPNCGYDNLPGSEQCAECLQDLTHLDLPAAQTRIEKSLMDEPVSALKPARAFSISASTTVREAIQTMLDKNVGALLVVDASGQLAGIFTERDILYKVIDGEDAHHDRPVSEFMTANPEKISLHDKLCFALHKMDVGGYRHLPVIDGNQQLAGIISVRDFLRYIRTLCRE